jgi:hypothetical protein
MAHRVKERIEDGKSVAEEIVILSGAGISLREILAESKDPCELYECGGGCAEVEKFL